MVIPVLRGGRVIMVTGRNLDVVQQPIISVWVEPLEVQRVKRRRRLALLTAKQQLVFNSSMTTVRQTSQSQKSLCLYLCRILFNQSHSGPQEQHRALKPI